MAVRIVRWGALLGLGVVWWWAVLRLVLAPGAGVLEGAIAAGGWGLSLLPVHCVPKASATRVVGITGARRGLGRGGAVAGPTRASPHRRWGG
ncbi:hypothetical protein PV331_21825 [Streptomyces sp. WI04-05B]|nr:MULTISPECIES: hypothetical protein [unclassified Streptomyces]MDX2544468.1 hypothetical protein [Streptomyces sp. WI04-05B]MDX2587883.1 hypothetical protein [Streptomyces sp. WI04-05A]